MSISAKALTMWNVKIYDKDWNLKEETTDRNTITTQGHNKILGVMFNAATQISTWYIGLFETNTTPSTATTYATPVFTECTAYSELVRQTFTESAPTGGSLDNSANKASFTMSTTKTLYGAFLCSATTKGDTIAAGAVIYAASKFAASKSVINGDIIKITVTVTQTNA